MTSSVGARRQYFSDNRKAFVSAERLDSASNSSSPARLQSNQQSETPVLSDAQMQTTSEIEVKSTEAEEEVEDQQGEEEEEEALRHIMRDLKEITGFDSYKAYLESFLRDPMFIGRSYADILHGCFHNPNDAGSGVDILDVSNMDLCPTGVRIRCKNLSASEISGALCHPPPGTSAQVVLWPNDTFTRDIEDFLNVLGVGLKLDPCFFEPLRWREDVTTDILHFRSKNSLCVKSIGTGVFVAPSFALAQDNPVPVVLIAGPLYEPIERFNQISPENMVRYDINQRKAIYDLVQATPLCDDYSWDDKPLFANVYTRALYNLLGSGRGSELTSSDILSSCIIPLLQIEIAICKVDLDKLSRSFHEMKDSYFDAFGFKTKYRGRYERRRDATLPSGEAPEYLYRYRTKLRSWIEYFENQNGTLMGLLSPLLGQNVAEGTFYRQIKGESISIAKEASRLEAEIRDHLQLQGSKLALLESQKSIELSNNQLYEGKRLKIFTILAFFYVPLNLATSIFGMNLQQLNGVGKSIGVFLGTAGIILFVTGVSWYFIEGIQNIRV